MAPAEATDAELAMQIMAGAADAREAEAELYRRLAPRVRLFALRWLRDEHAAGDVVQRVLLLTIERLRAGGVREPEQLASFVLGTCRMTLRDSMRQAARTERALADYARTLPTMDVPAGPSLDRRRLADCLARLGERERSVVVMTFFADRTSEQIMDEFGLSAANVRVIRHRAQARLLACMEQHP
jgi:RNA polymerase sigma-70 factor (ECF subfamily)